MYTRHRVIAAQLASAFVISLSACGGSSTNSAPQPLQISGVAATGAAFAGAVVQAIDASGRLVGTSQKVGEDGLFSIILRGDAQAPFVLQASRTDANGESQTLVSVIETTGQTYANITPITTLIASRLSPSGDPARLIDDLTVLTQTRISEAKAEVREILQPLLLATDTYDTDPIKDVFTVNGAGYDRLLDTINIQIIPASSTTANIEISVKQLQEDEQPTLVTFASDAQELPQLPVVQEENLLAAGTSLKISDLLRRMTNCYALPASLRVSGSDVIQAEVCRDIFHGKDPSSFLNNGSNVSSYGAFASLFNSAAVGVTFTQGSYEFTRKGGDLVIGYKSSTADGADSFGTFVVREGPDSKLRLIGNQYQYPGGVVPYQQLRRFITLGNESFSYYSTGYVLNVTNLQDSTKKPVFDRVEVTSPRGNVLTLLPNSGSSNLTLPDENGLPSGTNFVRLRSEPVDLVQREVHPRAYDSAALYFVGKDYEETELASIPSQAVWTFRYFLAGNTTDNADAIQTYKTRTRALTIAELRTKGLASLTPAMIGDIASRAIPAGQSNAGQLRLQADEALRLQANSGADGWMVSAGQLAPTGITVFGRSPTDKRFDDSVSVSSTARRTILNCSKLGGADDHCYANSDNSYGPGYAADSRINGLHLFSRESTGREYAHFYAMYALRAN